MPQPGPQRQQPPPRRVPSSWAALCPLPPPPHLLISNHAHTSSPQEEITQARLLLNLHTLTCWVFPTFPNSRPRAKDLVRAHGRARASRNAPTFTRETERGKRIVYRRGKGKGEAALQSGCQIWTSNMQIKKRHTGTRGGVLFHSMWRRSQGSLQDRFPLVNMRCIAGSRETSSVTGGLWQARYP